MYHDNIHGCGYYALFGTFRLFLSWNQDIAYNGHHLLHLQPIGVPALLHLYQKLDRAKTCPLASGNTCLASHHLWNNGGNGLLANAKRGCQSVYQSIPLPFSFIERLR